jgi:UDP-2,4-diacetamido-2,4,6-trideoxy-beta-L-altropyranose hydrolase
MNTLFIRADATTDIGTGHVMRCLALAQAWQDRGGKVIFISHCESDALRQRLIEEEEMNFITIEKSHPDPSDQECTMGVLHEFSKQNLKNTAWLVIDGYHFDAAYQKRIKEAGYKLLWIDDYGHADHYYADLVLNQNISADESFYIHREPDTRLLLGTRYALLRREFKQWQGWQREIPLVARKVLVTLGGGDPNNATLKVIQALKQVHIPGMEAKIVVGPANPNLSSLELEIVDHSNFQLVMNASNMPELMVWADLAVSAGGSTCWEMALLGLPNMIMYFADNQRPIAEKLHESGAALSMGWSYQLTIESITQNIENILFSQERRKGCSTKSQHLVDGSGAHRVCQDIM